MNHSLDQSASWRLTLILGLIAVIGLVVGVQLFTSAFPEASIDFKLSKSDASERAKAFLATLGYDLEGYQHVIVFDYDDQAKIYLEREIGLEKANQLMRSEINVWRWHDRRFIPLQKEEFHVYLDPVGRLAGFRHVIEESRAGESLSPDGARKIATDFLRSAAELPLDQYTLVEEKEVKRPKRKDHVLTWERQGFKAKDATYRVEVTIQGSEVGGYREFLKVPEEWLRGFREMRSHNDLLQSLATVFFVILLLAMVIVLFVKMSQREIRWRLPLILGSAMFGLQLLQGFNSLPLALINFDTTKTMGAFLVGNLGLIVMQSLGAALLVFLPVAAGEIYYRQFFPSKLAMQNLFNGRATGSVEFMQSSITGYLFVLVHFGFLTSFYYFGKNLGFWSPAEVNYTNAVSTAIPWITPLALSFNASLFEECTFRLFAIPLLKRYLKSTWLAIIIPAFIWGFLHSAYPQQPSYIRGVEVGLIGIAAGWIMMRYGILATIIWHYVVDAFLIGLFLFRSSNLYFQTSGAIVVGGLLIPLFIAVGVRLKQRRFIDVSHLSNANQPDVVRAAILETPADKTLEPGPTGLSMVHEKMASSASRRLAFLIVVALVGSLCLYFLKIEEFGKFARYRINAAEAGRMSDAYLEKLGVDPSAFKRSTTIVNAIDTMQSTYIYRLSDTEELNRIYTIRLPGLVWKTRYFKPLQKEEYWVSFSIGGEFYNYRHLIDEMEPGASLEKKDALDAATEYLKGVKATEVADWALVKSESKKLEHRIDHDFEWEDPRAVTGEAKFRVGVGLLGDEVQGFHSYLKVPEDWVLKETERTFSRILLENTKIILGVSILFLIIALFSLRLHRRQIEWKWALKKTGWVLPVILVFFFNSIPSLMNQYSTQIGYKVFWATMGLVYLILLLFAGAAVFMLLAAAHSILRQFSAGRVWWPDGRRQKMATLFFGITAGYCLHLGFSGMSRLVLYATESLGLKPSAVSPSLFLGAGDSYPVLTSIARAYMGSILELTVLICLVGFLFCYIATPSKRIILIAIGLLLTAGGNVHGVTDFLLPFLAHTILVAFIYLIGKNWIGLNLIAFGTWLFVGSLAPDVQQMLQQPESFLRWNGWVGMTILILPLLLALTLRFRMRLGQV